MTMLIYAELVHHDYSKAIQSATTATHRSDEGSLLAPLCVKRVVVPAYSGLTGPRRRQAEFA
jgi:hypothetical protein